MTQADWKQRFEEMKKPTAAMTERLIYLVEEIPGKWWAVNMTSVWLDDGTPEPRMTITLLAFGNREAAEDYLRRARHILEFALRCARSRPKVP